ncbi:hypothetical protein EQG64_05005 [Streptomyces sp. S6]|nr:hypothetical protein EQG64_05005 [Streptomyces sp. S6]
MSTPKNHALQGEFATVTNQRVRDTSRLLNQLLTSRPAYTEQWLRHAKRTGGPVNQSAVAKVFDDYMFDSGEGQFPSSRVLKDRISRALSGTVLTPQTLNWFIGAFDMSESDAVRLRETLNGRTSLPPGISHTLRTQTKLARPQRHRTISLMERYVFGPTGTLSTRHTRQMIRAAEDGVESYIFSHEPEVQAINVLQGGRLGQRLEYGEGLKGVEIVLETPLNTSQVTALEYDATFRDCLTSPTQVRRVAYARAEQFSLTVQFSELRKPREAWWCVWDDHFARRPLEERPVNLRKNSLVHFLPYFEQAVVGFRWGW